MSVKERKDIVVMEQKPLVNVITGVGRALLRLEPSHTRSESEESRCGRVVKAADSSLADISLRGFESYRRQMAPSSFFIVPARPNNNDGMVHWSRGFVVGITCGAIIFALTYVFLTLLENEDDDEPPPLPPRRGRGGAFATDHHRSFLFSQGRFFSPPRPQSTSVRIVEVDEDGEEVEGNIEDIDD